MGFSISGWTVWTQVIIFNISKYISTRHTENTGFSIVVSNSELSARNAVKKVNRLSSTDSKKIIYNFFC